MSTKQPAPPFIQLPALDQSTLSALANKDFTQYLRVTKLALRQYFQACLDANGQFREFFDKFATYTIGFHVNRKLSDNLNDRHIQIAAFWEGARERTPMIFIQDGGYNYIADSLGSLNAGWNMLTRNGEQTVRVMDVVPIPITISCVAGSEQEVEDLAAFLSLAIGQCQKFLSGYVIRPHTRQAGVYWEVRLPLRHTMGTKSRSPKHEDPRAQIWQIDCSCEVEFENSVYMQYRAQPQSFSIRADLTLQVPSVLVVGHDHRILLLNRPEPVSVYSDDPRIADVRLCGREWIIHPRRVGTFNLLVTRTVGNQEGPDILTQQQIEVRTR